MIQWIQNFSIVGWLSNLWHSRLKPKKPFHDRHWFHFALLVFVALLSIFLAMWLTECEHQRNQASCEAQVPRPDCLSVEYISGRVCMCWRNPPDDSEAFVLRRD